MKPIISEIFRASFTAPDGSYTDEISQKEIDLLFDHGLLKVFLPKNMNGLGLSLIDTMEIIREAAYLNGSLGWLVQIGNGGNYFASCFNEEIATKLFSAKKNVIAGSGTPSGKVELHQNGFLINGKWPFCSGSEYAELFTISFIHPSSGEKFAAVVPRKEVNIIQDWKTIGLRNTSTHSIELKDIYVPKEFVFDVNEQRSLQDHPAFSVPFVIYAQVFFLQVVFGVTTRLLFETQKLIHEKEDHWKLTYPNKMQQLEELCERLNFSLKSYQIRTLDLTNLYQNGGNHDLEEQHRKELVHYAKWLRDSVHELVGELGITVIYEDHPISIFYRDLIVVCQHYLLRE
jgi:indole-3-acetate monooxygenase